MQFSNNSKRDERYFGEGSCLVVDLFSWDVACILVVEKTMGDLLNDRLPRTRYFVYCTYFVLLVSLCAIHFFIHYMFNKYAHVLNLPLYRVSESTQARRKLECVECPFGDLRQSAGSSDREL